MRTTFKNELIQKVGAIFVFYLVALCTESLFAQQVDTAWVRRYNGAGNGSDSAAAIITDKNGNVYVTGSSFDSTSGYDYVTIKYDPNGDTVWIRRYDGPAHKDDYANALGIDEVGNVYVTGSSYIEFNPMAFFRSGFSTLKYNSMGNLLWVRSYYAALEMSSGGGYALAIDKHQNVYVTGWLFTEFFFEWVTIKYDSLGDMSWFSNSGSPVTSPSYSIAVDSEGNTYVTNSAGIVKIDSLGDTLWTRAPGGVDIVLDRDNYIYVALSGAVGKYDHQGNQLWIKEPFPWVYYGYQLVALGLDGLGNIYATGHFWDVEARAWITIKWDSLGNQLWAQHYYGVLSYQEFSSDLVVDSDNNVYVTGLDGGRYATVKYDPQGNQIWRQTYSGPVLSSRPTSIGLDSAGNVYVSGFSLGSGTGNDIATIKYIQFLKGDLDGDGILGLADIVLELNCVFMGEGDCPARVADLNCDGSMSAADVVILLLIFYASFPPPC